VQISENLTSVWFSLQQEPDSRLADREITALIKQVTWSVWISLHDKNRAAADFRRLSACRFFLQAKPCPQAISRKTTGVMKGMKSAGISLHIEGKYRAEGLFLEIAGS
jgi:hypothetical protein